MNIKSARPLVSVVIPHYGGKEIISECIQSLYNCTYSNIELIVLDNNSPDNSHEFIKINFPKVKLLQSKYNRGFAGGCNMGIQYAKGKYILILNNDTTHEPKWIDYLVEFMESNPFVSSVQPKIKNYYKKNYFDYAGACGGYIDKYCFPFARGRIFNTVEKDNGQYDKKNKIFWASGTAFLTRKTIFKKMGGFDEVLFAHMEEIDYHWKCQSIGYEVWVEPKSIVYHKGATTLPTSSPKKTYLNYRNSLILLLSNYSIAISLKLFFPRIIFEFISLIKEILSFKWLHAIAIICSWFWIVSHIGILIRKRNFFNSLGSKKKINIYQQSIVMEYFFYRNKYYSNYIN